MIAGMAAIGAELPVPVAARNGECCPHTCRSQYSSDRLSRMETRTPVTCIADTRLTQINGHQEHAEQRATDRLQRFDNAGLFLEQNPMQVALARQHLRR